MSTTRPESFASVRRYSASSLGGLGVAGAVLVVLALLPSLVGESIVNRLTQLFALLILAVSIGSALLADIVNPRLRRGAQIETLYGKPVIATRGKAK